jgi:hypothetical protein
MAIRENPYRTPPRPESPGRRTHHHLIQVRAGRRERAEHDATIRRRIMNSNRRLWIGLGALLAVSFSVLLWVGTEIHRVMPPIPARVVSEYGDVLYTRADIEKDARSGSPSAASSSVQSGATAVMSHPTGRPTGCTVKPWPGWTRIPARATPPRTPTLAPMTRPRPSRG